MRMKTSVIALGLFSSLTLYGCGSDDSEESTTSYSVKAIDGYLNGALVWLDLNENFQLDEGEPSATSQAGGVATLDVDGIEDPSIYPVVVQAIANETIDEDTGNAIITGFTMSAPPGVAQVTPLSTLVHLEVKSGGSADIAAATTKIANQLGINEADVLSDYGTDSGSKTAAFAARNLVSSQSIPESPSELNDAANDTDGTNEVLDNAAEKSATIKTTVESSSEEELENIYLNSAGNLDEDSDGDGFPNADDDFDDDPLEWRDTDQDGTGDNADTDDDDDGVLDADDAFPRNGDETTDTDGDGIGDNADPDIDGDGYLNEDDDFQTNPLEWLDTDDDGTGNNADTDDDGDGVLDTEDDFPLDSSETTDTDGDGIGNEADTDDDGDGVPDVIDGDALDPDVGASDIGQIIAYMAEQTTLYAVYADEDDNDVMRVYSEQLDVNGTMATMTTQTVVKANKTEVGVDIGNSDWLLTSSGWATQSGEYTIDFSNNLLVAYPTDYPDMSYSLSGSLTSLVDEVIAESDFDWDEYTDESATFPADSYLIKLGLTPTQDTYYLWDWTPYLHDNLNSDSRNDITALSELIFDTLGASSVSTGEFQGMSIGEDIAVKFVDDSSSKTAQYYTIDWDSGFATLVATSTWSLETVNTESLLLFSVPSAALTAFGDDFDEPTADMLVSVYDGAVYIGNHETADVLLEKEDIVLISAAAKEALINAADIPLTQCNEGDSDGTTTVGMTEFEAAIESCLGASPITSEMVSGQNFHRIRGDGSTRDYTFNADGSLTVYKDSVESYTALWTIENNYVKITYEGNTEESWYWALVDYNDTNWSLKFLETYLEDTTPITEIWADTVSLVDVGSCVIEEGLEKTYSDFVATLSAYEQCHEGLPSISTADLDGAELYRVKSNGETRLYTFASDGTATYYKDGVARSRTWSINDEGFIEIRYSDTGIDQYLALLDEPENDELQFAVFAPDDSEIWLTQYTSIDGYPDIEECTTGNSDYDENDDPITTSTYAEYTQYVDDCLTTTGSGAAFSSDFMEQLPRSMNTTYDGEVESYTFNADGATGTYSEGAESFNFSWSVDDELGELIITLNVNGQTYIDNIRIVDSDGVQFSMKVLSRSTELDGTDETSGGDLWTGIYTFE